MDIHYTYKIENLFDIREGVWVSEDALYVFAHALRCCGMATQWAEDCPKNLLTRINANDTPEDDPFLASMQTEALKMALDEAKRNAEQIPELEMLLAEKVAA